MGTDTTSYSKPQTVTVNERDMMLHRHKGKGTWWTVPTE